MNIEDVCKLNRQIVELQDELADVKLELSCPETTGMDDKPLHEWAAVIQCEKLALQSQNQALREALEKIKSDWKKRGNSAERDYNDYNRLVFFAEKALNNTK